MRKTLRSGALLALLLAATACGGGGGEGDPTDPAAPSNLLYAFLDGLYRANEPITPNTATVTGTVDMFTVTPPLPAGLQIDPDTGEITGTPTTPGPASQFTVTATNQAGATTAQVGIHVGPALPAEVTSLAPGFLCTRLAAGLAVVTKIALAPAPDDRIFFTEVGGRICTIPRGGGTVSIWVNDVGVTGGGHHGLIGLALDPDFANNGFVYVQATAPGVGMNPPRTQIVRYTDMGGAGTNRTEIFPMLPASPAMDINNGGELLFDEQGALLISIGDINDPSTSQAPTTTSMAGKILRVIPTAPPTIPPDNPFNNDYEFCRGLRNTFGLAIHPGNQEIFGVDNGPMFDDELNLIEGGKNYEWENAMPPAGEQGFKVRNYADVIVPTGLFWHDGTGWGPEFVDDLFMSSYDEHTIRRFEMSFDPGLAIDDETIWAQFLDQAGQNHPLDLEIDRGTGDLYVSTFSGIFHFSKQ